MTTTVRDSGSGFDPGAVANPLDRENLLGESGRGILMMRAYSDEVEFRQPDDGGTEVTMIKRMTQHGGDDEGDGS